MRIKTLLLTLTLGASMYMNAQVKYVRDANRSFRQENYCEATDKCALAYSKIRKSTRAALEAKGLMAFKTAEAFRFVEDYKQAAEWYSRAILLKYQDKEPVVYYHLAEMQREVGEYKLAKENYEKYKALVPGDALADVGLESCAKSEEFVESRTRHTVTNVGVLNKDNFEMSPMFIDKKDNVIAFSSNSYEVVGKGKDPRTCQTYMDLFVTSFDKKGNLTEVKPIPGDSINTEDNEGTICIDDRAKVMFFTRCPNVKKKNLGCDIWMSESDSKGWKIPTKLNLKTADSISVGHPCVTGDGKFLVFASDMPGGLGGRDLWYTTYDRKSETWASPINMGPVINTAGDELFPTIARNGDLYYSSNGLPGMGGLDIYKAAKVGTENKWENPTNIGSPINSNFNDYGLVEKDDRTGYFTSERVGSKGDGYNPDIWFYELPPNLFSLEVVVFDESDKSRTTKIDGVKVVVQNTAVAGDKWEGITNKEGKIFWDKKPNGTDRFVNENSSYKITISKAGFYEDKKGAALTTVGLNYDQNFVIDMGLFPIRPIRLPEVRYPLGKWDLLVDSSINSKDSLLFVYNLLQEYPSLVLELSSHTDPRGNDKFNQVLSENRAKACYKFLVEEKGVDPRRIVPVGKGEASPRKMYLVGDKYFEKPQKDASGNVISTEVVLTEAYINGFKKDKKKYEMLMQYNRRTEGAIITLDGFDPNTYPAAKSEYLQYVPLPKAK